MAPGLYHGANFNLHRQCLAVLTRQGGFDLRELEMSDILLNKRARGAHHASCTSQPYTMGIVLSDPRPSEEGSGNEGTVDKGRRKIFEIIRTVHGYIASHPTCNVSSSPSTSGCIVTANTSLSLTHPSLLQLPRQRRARIDCVDNRFRT